MTHVEFEFFHKLPEPPKPPTLLELFAESLRDRPRVWGKWPKPLKPNSVKSIPSSVNRGMYPVFPRGEFEATRRDGVVYVRYLGPRHLEPVDADIDETPDEYDDAPVRAGTQRDQDVERDRDIDAKSGV
ncbi:hypothetical protein ACW9HF_14995 [Nocardia gipuzkoensis]